MKKLVALAVVLLAQPYAHADQLAKIMSACEKATSGEACAQLGRAAASSTDPEMKQMSLSWFTRACVLGVEEGCTKLQSIQLLRACVARTKDAEDAPKACFEEATSTQANKVELMMKVCREVIDTKRAFQFDPCAKTSPAWCSKKMVPFLGGACMELAKLMAQPDPAAQPTKR